MHTTPKINLLAPVSHTDPKWHTRRIVRVVVFALVLSVSGLLTVSAAAPGEHFEPIIAQLTPPALMQGFGHLLLANEKTLTGQDKDRVNILLLGIGGEGHDGANLTDTIIFLSYQPSTKKVALLSIPRDLLVQIPNYGWGKINAVNAIAEKHEPGSGGAKTTAFVSALLNQDIPYSIRIDFNGFNKFIDALGGVLVYVDKSFTDYQYPTIDDKYQTISFKAGWQRMNGETALEFARSRHGNNMEGSDYARSQRQQKILQAVKDEMLTSGALANPATITNLLSIVASHVQTNLGANDLIGMMALARDAKTDNIVHKTLDPASGGPLVASWYGDAWVLVSPTGSYDPLKKIAADIFNVPVPVATSPTTPAPIAVQAPPAELQATNIASVEIQNGTTISGYATRASTFIKNEGFRITTLGNAPSTGYDRTVIYDVSQGKYPNELLKLRRALNADVSVTLPEWFSIQTLPASLTVDKPATKAQDTDFLVILGKSSMTAIQ